MPWAALSILGAGAWLGAASLSWFTDDEKADGWDWTISVFLVSAMVGAVVMAYIVYGFLIKPLIGAR